MGRGGTEKEDEFCRWIGKDGKVLLGIKRFASVLGGLLKIVYFCIMIELAKYIEVILLDHDCVILSGLGGFVAHKEHAYATEGGTQLYPPRRSVCFNAMLTVNDGLLVQSIMQSFDTDYPNASRILEEEIKRIKILLQNNGQWEVGCLGTLEIAADGTYQFYPTEEGGIASPALFGLDSFVMKPFVQGSAAEKELKGVADYPVEDAGEDEEEEPKRGLMKPWVKDLMKYAAIFVGFIVVFFAFSVPVSNMGIHNGKVVSQANGVFYGFPINDLYKNSCNSFHKIALSPAGKKVGDTPAATPKTETKAKSEGTAAAEEQSKPVEKDYYTIVLASQVKQSNAEVLIDDLAAAGFAAGKFFKKNKMKRVVYASYNSEDEARDSLRVLKKQNKQFEEGWILHVSE